MQKAISTPNQGPRSKIMSEKNRGQKSRVSVPLNQGVRTEVTTGVTTTNTVTFSADVNIDMN